jgi:hypothetical protein
VVTEDGPHPWPELLTIAATPEPGSALPAVSPRALPWAALGPRTTGNRGSAADNSSNQMPWSEHVPADRCRPKMRPSSTLKATVQGKPILPPSSDECSYQQPAGAGGIATAGGRTERLGPRPQTLHTRRPGTWLELLRRCDVVVQPEQVVGVVPLLDLD